MAKTFPPGFSFWHPDDIEHTPGQLYRQVIELGHRNASEGVNELNSREDR
jgi:hypothetical protein